MRIPVLYLAILLLAPPAYGQVVTKNPVSNGAVTPETIGKRLNETAERTRKAAPNGAARGAVIDFAWPQDAKEYRALAKYVIVLISAVSQDARELPLRRVYVRPKRGRDIALEKIGSERRGVPKNSVLYDVLGPYREDGFYLAPAGTMMKEGTLMADFAARRKEFRLYVLPGDPPDFVEADRHPMPAPGAKPDPKALKAMLEREYTGFQLPAGLQ